MSSCDYGVGRRIRIAGIHFCDRVEKRNCQVTGTFGSGLQFRYCRFVDGIRSDRTGFRSMSFCPTGRDQNIWPKRAKFGGDAAFGVDLEIQEGGSDGGACSESEENDEEAATVGEGRA